MKSPERRAEAQVMRLFVTGTISNLIRSQQLHVVDGRGTPAVCFVQRCIAT